MPIAELVRRTQAPMGVAVARLAARPGRPLLVIAGVAVATAMLVGVLGASLLARDRALQQALAALPEDERSVRVDLVGLPAQQDLVTADRTVRDALSAFTSAPPIRVVFFRDVWLDGQFIRLVAVDGLADLVRLRSGRLPRTCRPEACEVAQMGAAGRRELHEGEINLVRVGVGELGDVGRYGPAFQRLTQFRAQSSLVTSVVLLAPSVSSLERLVPLRLLFRVRSWVAPLETTSIRSWQIGSLLARETRVRTQLQEADPAYVLSAPDSVLVDARERGDVSGRRLLLVGGGASAVLLVFALTAAVGLRRGLAAERRRLLQRGATTSQAWIALVTEVVLMTLVGWLLGLLLGASAIAILSTRLNLSAGATLRHGLLDPPAALALALALIVATCAVVATSLVYGEGSGRRRVGVIEIAAVGAVLAVALGLSRGAFSADQLASEGDRTLLLILPWLVCFVGGVVAFRLLSPLMRVAERAARAAPTALRLALLALARAPAQSALAGAGLVVALGLALFAISYSATLERGTRDESAFSVPLDVTLSIGERLALPLDVAALSRYEQLGRDVHAYPVLRRSADVAGVGTSTESVTVVGLPQEALATMRWRSDYSPRPRAQLDRSLFGDGPASLRAVELPRGATSLALRVRLRGIPLRVDLALQDARGRIETVSLGRAAEGRTTLTGRIRPDRRMRRLVALQLSLPTAEQNWLLHLANEGRVIRAPSGTLSLELLTAATPRGRSVVVRNWHGWVLRDGGTTVRPGLGGRLDVLFREATTLVVRLVQPTDRRPLLILASPDLAEAAGPGGRLVLRFYEPDVSARIVGIARRFPTVPGDEPFIVVDGSRLEVALDADAPGTASPGELWLSAPHDALPSVEASLRRPPFDKLDLTSREAQLEQLEHDPFARAIVYTLLAVAVVALVLATIGLWITLLGQLRDERGELFDLEAQGVPPETLRSQLRFRAYGLLAYGVAGGVLLGVALSRVVVSLVQVSASTTSSELPLLLDPGWTDVALALGILVAACVLVAEGSVRHSFRGETPGQAAA